jgi:hypothetical protein
MKKLNQIQNKYQSLKTKRNVKVRFIKQTNKNANQVIEYFYLKFIF